MSKPVSVRILSSIITYMKYAKYIPEIKRRESWEELCERNASMHIRKYPQLRKEIQDVYRGYVVPKKVLPSMRSLQFAGRPVDVNPTRVYNCAFAPVDSVAVFSEAMFLLLGGTGFGYSVQRHHVAALPPLIGPKARTRRFVVGDSIEGWADAIKVLMEAYFQGKSLPDFDYSDIRPKGALLITSGGKAPGPQPLKDCIYHVTNVLNAALERGEGTKLKTIEAHDILCFVADAVLAGGIRRAALISLFSLDDEEMMTCKVGTWYELHPQRGRANNSVVLDRTTLTYTEFKHVWRRIVASGTGEPGVYLTNNVDWGTNPCCEIALRPFQFCNLTEINADDVDSQEELNNRAKAAAFLGTLQAGYTNFHYLRPIWQETTEKDALIGCGMTGIGSGKVLTLDTTEAAGYVLEENRRVAELIGINPAARTTTVKPAGTSSLVLGSASGIHAWHNDFYIRRVRVGKNEAIYKYLAVNVPSTVVDDFFRPETSAIIEVPQAAPEGAILRTESPAALLERVKTFNEGWVAMGHRNGDNRHNVSCTISVKEDEWNEVGEWMWDNRNSFNGISVLPYDGGTYVQAPFEDISKQEYEERLASLHDIDLSQVSEEEDNTDLQGELACAGGACAVI